MKLGWCFLQVISWFARCFSQRRHILAWMPMTEGAIPCGCPEGRHKACPYIALADASC